MKYALHTTFLVALLFIGNITSFASPCAGALIERDVNPTDCLATDGSIIFNGVAPTLTYTVDYLFNGVPQPTLTITPATTDLIISGLAAGNYDNIIINNTAQGCTWGPFATVLYDPVLAIDSVWSIDPAQCGTTTGAIFLAGFVSATTYTVNIILNGTPQPAMSSIAAPNGVITLPTMGSGAYDITVSRGACTSNSVNINLYDPVFSSNYDYTVHLGCSGDTVVFQNESENALNYTWDFGDGNNGTEPNPTHVYTTQGVYTVVLHTFNGSCEKTTTHEITLVHPVVASFTMDRDSICARQDVYLDGTASTNAYTYLWNFGDGKVDSSNNPRPHHFYKDPGTYNVTLTVNDFVPCPNSLTQPLTVAPFNMVFDHPDTSVCVHEPMKITSITNAESYSGPITYSWSPAAGLNDSTLAEPMFYAADTQSHLYIVTATTPAPFNCLLVDSVRIFAQPHVHLLNVTPKQTIHFGSTVHLNADGGYYYTWLPATGLDNSNIKDPVAMPNEPTLYTVYAMNQYGGCRDSATIMVDYVNDQEFIPSAFTPNGDGKNDVFKIVNMRSQILLQFRVYDRWGQLLFNTTDPSQGWDGKYNGNVMDAGVYLYIINVGQPDGSQKTYRGDVTLLR